MPFLDWINKNQAKEATGSINYHLLNQVGEYGKKSENLLIQGDNLLALKALIPFYEGQVKCIYADPPFNTKQAFPNYDDKLEHSQWLSMIYPILELQRSLLSSEGTLFLHIDDNELGYLIAVADEVMGRKNRVGIITFKQGAATGHKSINPGMVSTTNFILVYAKNKSKWRPRRIFTGRDRDKRYGHFLVNPHEHYKNWKLTTLTSAFSKSIGKTAKEAKKEMGPNAYEEALNEFVISHATQVIQPVRPDYDAVSEEARKIIDKSLDNTKEVFHLERPGYTDMYFQGGQRWIFYREKLKEVDGKLVAGEPLTTLWDDLLSNNLHTEGGIEFPKSKKPEALIKRVIDLSGCDKGDLVLDAFLGSGTTAAVAHKLGLKWIGIERGEHAKTKCLPRLKDVVDGDQTGISKIVGWNGGGGFRFCSLGDSAFDSDGRINPSVSFSTLAAFVWHFETGEPGNQVFDKPLLGIHKGTAYYLLYNGILGDRRPASGNVLTNAVLEAIKGIFPHDGPMVVYGETCRLGSSKLSAEQITFKQIPYDVKMR